MKMIIGADPKTKKNSQRIVYAGGHPRIMPSVQYLAYAREAAKELRIYATEPPIDYPVNIRCVYYMRTKRKVDLVNLLEATDDILVAAGILADDNSTIIVGHDGSRVKHDKDCPRTEIYIEEVKDDQPDEAQER